MTNILAQGLGIGIKEQVSSVLKLHRTLGKCMSHSCFQRNSHSVDSESSW